MDKAKDSAFINLIKNMPKALVEDVIETHMLACFIADKNKSSYKGVDVTLKTKRGNVYETSYMDMEEAELFSSDEEGHLRVMNMDYLKDIKIKNRELLRAM